MPCGPPDSACFFCGETERVEIFEVWTDHTFMLDTCCARLHGHVCEELARDPASVTRWLGPKLEAATGASARKGGPAGQAMVDEALHLDVRVVGQEPLQGGPEAWLCGNRGDLGKPVQKLLASNGCPARKPVRMRYAGACAEIRRGARTPVCAAAEGVPLGERSRPPMAPRYEIRLINVGPPPGHLRSKAATDETAADKSAPAAGQGHGPSAVRRVHRTGAVPSLPVPSASPLPWPCHAGPRRGYSGGPSHPLPTRP